MIYSDFISNNGYVISLDYRGTSRIQSHFHFEGREIICMYCICNILLNNLVPSNTESKQSLVFIVLGNTPVHSQTWNYFR